MTVGRLLMYGSAVGLPSARTTITGTRVFAHSSTTCRRSDTACERGKGKVVGVILSGSHTPRLHWTHIGVPEAPTKTCQPLRLLLLTPRRCLHHQEQQSPRRRSRRWLLHQRSNQQSLCSDLPWWEEVTTEVGRWDSLRLRSDNIPLQYPSLFPW